jgi:Protein of unknown function (DUF3048) N-terminal domain/Protein of unknown function (DUF3048) C-terminal domain
MRNRRRLIVATVLTVVVALIAGLILTSGQGRSPATRPAASTRVLSPFTGEQVTALREVLAVKIDNVAQARPQTGLGRADIVYVLPVEGGLTRLLAVFSADPPPAVGPVRSAREADLELLAQFGRPAFAYSGAAPELLPFVAKARIVDLYSGRTGGYIRDPARPAPHNLYAEVDRLLANAAPASKARDIGFRFGPASAGGHAVREYQVSYPAASLGFTWSADRNRWLVSMDGRPATSTDGDRLAAATVVVQHTTAAASRYLEAGLLPPYARTVGAGDALVLRDGHAFDARWSRPAADRGTTFTTAAGRPMTFAPGPVWIVLVPQAGR